MVDSANDAAMVHALFSALFVKWIEQEEEEEKEEAIDATVIRNCDLRKATFDRLLDMATYAAYQTFIPSAGSAISFFSPPMLICYARKQAKRKKTPMRQ